MALAGSASLVLSLAAVAGGATATDRLPDLRMARPGDFRVATLHSGRRLLRFTTVIVNAGSGPFELRLARASTTQTRMTVRQRIRRSDGTWRSISTGAVGAYAGDGHDHWHVQRVASYELFRTTGARARAGSKVGFCFFDTRRLGYLPGSATVRYRETGCGIRRSTSAVMGISRGWGDIYGWNFAYQWIDVTGLSGTFIVRVSVDPQNFYRETNERNNCAWARVRIPRSGSTVTVLERGSACQPAGIPSLPAPLPTPAPTPSPSAPPPSPSASASASPSASASAPASASASLPAAP